ncbi:hypothetical protein [Falsiruegeria mediterranea]|uniref:Uncharacterized protein n=1 Tax=Falsiruegeria mediterranea M17 TaxID=1200281 RepID=A0A2R8CGA4_9RHOB|nr:hypothetical protein [Falsiruegeria mediterranea]SPJ31472.1 hypothetical protein TRM7615_05015 [Falsiruegeria mediterranea M17]
MNQGRAKNFEAVKAVIERHLPMTCRSADAQMYDTVSDSLADILGRANHLDVHFSGFGVSHDVEEIEQLRRHLSAIQQVASSLSPSTVQDICHADWYRGLPYGEFPNLKDLKYSSILPEVLVHIEQLSLALNELEKNPTSKQRAGKKRNWRAIAVVAKCQKIWSEEHVLEEFRNSGRNPGRLYPMIWHEDYEEQVKGRREFDEAVSLLKPKSAHNDAPGPFGRFVEDVFEVLGITGPRGEPVRAASALRSLAEVERKQQNEKE